MHRYIIKVSILLLCIPIAAYAWQNVLVNGNAYQALSNHTELNAGSIHDVRPLIHKRFNGYQFKNFLPIYSLNLAQYDGNHFVTNSSLSYLEVKPLKNYHLTGSKEQKKSMEGVADYVGWNSVKVPDANYKDVFVKAWIPLISAYAILYHSPPKLTNTTEPEHLY